MKNFTLSLVFASAGYLQASNIENEFFRAGNYSKQFIQRALDSYQAHPIQFTNPISWELFNSAFRFFQRSQQWESKAEDVIALIVCHLYKEKDKTSPENQFLMAQLLYALRPQCSQGDDELRISCSLINQHRSCWDFNLNGPVRLDVSLELFLRVQPVLNALLAMDGQFNPDDLPASQYETPLALAIMASFARQSVRTISSNEPVPSDSLFRNEPRTLQTLILSNSDE